MVRRLLPAAAWLIALVAALWLVRRTFGRWPAVATAGAIAALFILMRMWLPRLAHQAFELGNPPRARLYYRVLALLRLSGNARASARLSMAACSIAEGRYAAARTELARVTHAKLSESGLATLRNNEAYVIARDGDDGNRALELADEALSLRPEVAGFRHTRGIALLAVGRIDDAVRELDEVWADAAGEPSGQLEAERCFDLGRAWLDKGEVDYAEDSFDRAQRADPDSRWAARAAELSSGSKLAHAERALAAL